MIYIDRVEVTGTGTAIRAMRNPLNSWAQSDSKCINYAGYTIGEADMQLALKLVRSGTDHSKFARMIVVYADITAPLYWWKEADTYRMGVEKNSCSTMHTLHKKEITLDDFSTDDMPDDTRSVMQSTVDKLEELRKRYLKTHDKAVWRAMIQLMPESYMQMRTCMISYAALRNMYRSRRCHKLSEWQRFCRWIESLPNSRLITEGINDNG